jgi:ring-1,2-phenylacetyl-CoA epoxidase subunit PaaB
MIQSPHPDPLPQAGEGAVLLEAGQGTAAHRDVPSSSLSTARGGEFARGPGGGEGVQREWPLWEVFVRSKQGLEHKHCGSLHAADARQALQMARDVYTRRQEGVSIWVVPSALITASEPEDKAEFFEPAGDKIYRHPSFYQIPDEVGHM